MTHLKFSTLPTNVDLDLNRILVFSASAFVCSCRSDSSLCFTVWRRSGIGAATSWDLSSDSNNNNICYSNNNNYYINNNNCSNNDVARRNVATVRRPIARTTPSRLRRLIVDGTWSWTERWSPSWPRCSCSCSASGWRRRSKPRTGCRELHSSGY